MNWLPYSADVAPLLMGLFPEDQPVPVRLWSILDGTILGRILVDDPGAPAFALVQELAEGTTYIGGAPTREALAAGIAQLRRERDVVIGLWPDSGLAALLPPSPDYEGVAIDFVDRSAEVDLGRLALPPSGCGLKRIGLETLPLLDGFDYYLSMYGSAERALQHTFGFCLVEGETLVSEAVAGPLTRGIAEIGVGTRASHQKKGFATITSARVIQECEMLGYQPFWNCSQQNTASIALAKRLGFQGAKPFKVLAWNHSF